MEPRGVTLKSSVSESHKYPDIVTLNETNMKNTRKINLKKYVLFCKNSKKNSHVISTSFAGYLKDSSVKVSQDQGGVDKFMVTRLENVALLLSKKQQLDTGMPGPTCFGLLFFQVFVLNLIKI